MILDDIYPAISAFITEEEFKDLYDYSTVEPRDALVIDNTKGKPIFFKKIESILNIS